MENMLLADELTTQDATSPQKRWLDDYPKRIGLTLSADANIVANYIWRGQYVGGLGHKPRQQ